MPIYTMIDGNGRTHTVRMLYRQRPKFNDATLRATVEDVVTKQQFRNVLVTNLAALLTSNP